MQILIKYCLVLNSVPERVPPIIPPKPNTPLTYH